AFALPPLPAYQRAAMTGDWRAARDEIVRLRQMPQKWRGAMKPIDAALFVPLLAAADPRLGDFADAHALIDGAAADCYLCTRVEGNVAALQRDWPAAERWYARAARLAPSLPFAWLD